MRYTAMGWIYVDAAVPEDHVVITDLPLGCTWIRYIIIDECGNVSNRKCAIEIVVVDKVKPVAVCDEHTIVTLGAHGTAKVFAESFDDLSWDNCEIDSFAVRKMLLIIGMLYR